MACGGMIFIKKVQILENKFFNFFDTFNFLMLLLLHKTLKGSRNIQGFALVRAVLFGVERVYISQNQTILYQGRT